ncbi:hypothetical protein BHM03_00003232 [Ensete ventricosum]|nr:hypothetical protein BHM03_00003232 [Ensete ventricosum]
MLYILRTEAEVSPRLGSARVHMSAQDSSLVPEGCASSSGRRLVYREPKRSPHAGVDFWSLVELQPPGVCCDVPRGVAYPQSGDLVWLAPVDEASLVASVSFCSSAGSPVVDA